MTDKTSEGTLKVQTLERDDGHTEIILTAETENSWSALDRVKNILLAAYPKAFQSGAIVGCLQEIRITVKSEKEYELYRRRRGNENPSPEVL